MVTLIAIIFLVILILLSAFFSSSETGMMALNRYRIRNLAKQNNPGAKRIQKFLKRPDKLLGVILIGNNLANIVASALATLIAESLFGSIGVVFSTMILTCVILLFSEIIPKRVAAVNPESVAFMASLPLKVCLWLLYPFVWLINIIANLFLGIFGINATSNERAEALNKEEIQSVVHQSDLTLTRKHKNMLLGVLELENITIADVLTPRHQIEGINLNWPLETITARIHQASHSILVCYEDDIDNIIGVLSVTRVLKHLHSHAVLGHDSLKEIIDAPYYVPDCVSLQTQLINFQSARMRLGIVVNEYGAIEGILTVEDILEEIVGEFSDTYNTEKYMKSLKEGAYVALGKVTLRELNRHLQLNLPQTGPKTLAGLITETLELIPDGPCCFKLDHYIIEVLKVSNNTIEQAKIYPQHPPAPTIS